MRHENVSFNIKAKNKGIEGKMRLLIFWRKKTELCWSFCRVYKVVSCIVTFFHETWNIEIEYVYLRKTVSLDLALYTNTHILILFCQL